MNLKSDAHTGKLQIFGIVSEQDMRHKPIRSSNKKISIKLAALKWRERENIITDHKMAQKNILCTEPIKCSGIS